MQRVAASISHDLDGQACLEEPRFEVVERRPRRRQECIQEAHVLALVQGTIEEIGLTLPVTVCPESNIPIDGIHFDDGSNGVVEVEVGRSTSLRDPVCQWLCGEGTSGQNGRPGRVRRIHLARNPSDAWMRE